MTWLHFWSIPRNRAMPRCATRGRSLLCFHTTACIINTFVYSKCPFTFYTISLSYLIIRSPSYNPTNLTLLHVWTIGNIPSLVSLQRIRSNSTTQLVRPWHNLAGFNQVLSDIKRIWQRRLNAIFVTIRHSCHQSVNQTPLLPPTSIFNFIIRMLYKDA